MTVEYREKLPVFCDEHDVEMVRDERVTGWRCPQGGVRLAEAEYRRLTRPSPLRSHAIVIRVLGCRVTDTA